MINKPSFLLLFCTVWPATAFGQQATYTSAFSAGQPTIGQQGYMTGAPTAPPVQGQYVTNSGHAGFEPTPAVNPYQTAGSFQTVSAPISNAGGPGPWLHQASHAPRPGCSSCGTAAPSANPYAPQQQYVPQQAYMPQQGYMPGASCNSCPSNIPMDMYVQSDPMTNYDAECGASDFAPAPKCRRGFGVETQAVFFQRRQPDNQTLFSNPAAAVEQIDGRDFSFDTAQGIEAAINVYDLDSAFDLELRATLLDDWSGQVNQTFTGPVVRIGSNPVVDGVGPRNATATYDSEYFSSELNARYRADAFFNGLTLMTGFRMFRVDEQLSATFVDPGAVLPNAVVRTNTQNRLFGLQLGADQVVFNNPNWFVKVTGRIGVYGNNGDQNSQLTSLTAPAAIQTADGGKGDVALHGEFGVMGKIRITQWANAVGGYRAILVDGLATASDQLNTTSFATRQGYNSNSSILMHGANVGLEIVF